MKEKPQWAAMMIKQTPNTTTPWPWPRLCLYFVPKLILMHERGKNDRRQKLETLVGDW